VGYTARGVELSLYNRTGNSHWRGAEGRQAVNKSGDHLAESR